MPPRRALGAGPSTGRASSPWRCPVPCGSGPYSTCRQWPVVPGGATGAECRIPWPSTATRRGSIDGRPWQRRPHPDRRRWRRRPKSSRAWRIWQTGGPVSCAWKSRHGFRSPGSASPPRRNPRPARLLRSRYSCLRRRNRPPVFPKSRSQPRSLPASRLPGGRGCGHKCAFAAPVPVGICRPPFAIPGSIGSSPAPARRPGRSGKRAWTRSDSARCRPFHTSKAALRKPETVPPAPGRAGN